MGFSLQHCGIMALATPLWLGAAAKLAGRMLVSPARYFRKVDRSAVVYPDPLPGMTHTTVDNGGVRLHVITHGSGSGKPLMLMLHGFPETWASWRHQIQAFAGEFEVAAMDLRGCGDSDVVKGVKSYTADKLCADVAAVVAALGHTKCILVGHGFGGSVAWHMAVLYPELVDRLVVMCSPHPVAYHDPKCLDAEQADRLRFLLTLQKRGLGEGLLRHEDFREVERLLRGHPNKPPRGTCTRDAFTTQDVERYKAALARPGACTAGLNLYRAALRVATKWFIPDLEKAMYTNITAPTLLLTADHDIFLPKMFTCTGRMVDCLTEVQLRDCSHWANNDRPVEVNDHIRTFLAGKGASSGAAAGPTKPANGAGVIHITAAPTTQTA